MNEEDILYALGYILLKRSIRRRKEKETGKGRKMWVRQIFKQRENCGIYHTLVQEMSLDDREYYFKYELCVFENTV